MNMKPINIVDEASLRAAWAEWEAIEQYLGCEEDISPERWKQASERQIEIERADHVHEYTIDEHDNYVKKSYVGEQRVVAQMHGLGIDALHTGRD